MSNSVTNSVDFSFVCTRNTMSHLTQEASSALVWCRRRKRSQWWEYPVTPMPDKDGKGIYVVSLCSTHQEKTWSCISIRCRGHVANLLPLMTWHDYRFMMLSHEESKAPSSFDTKPRSCQRYMSDHIWQHPVMSHSCWFGLSVIEKPPSCFLLNITLRCWYPYMRLTWDRSQNITCSISMDVENTSRDRDGAIPCAALGASCTFLLRGNTHSTPSLLGRKSLCFHLQVVHIEVSLLPPKNLRRDQPTTVFNYLTGSMHMDWVPPKLLLTCLHMGSCTAPSIVDVGLIRADTNCVQAGCYVEKTGWVQLERWKSRELWRIHLCSRVSKHLSCLFQRVDCGQVTGALWWVSTCSVHTAKVNGTGTLATMENFLRSENVLMHTLNGRSAGRRRWRLGISWKLDAKRKTGALNGRCTQIKKQNTVFMIRC